MHRTRDEPTIPWLEPGAPFPPVAQAMDSASGAPGLLAAGGSLDVDSLLSAYRHGIFPWFSEGQPILWWSTDPRMVLRVVDFRLHPSLRKTLRHFARAPNCEIRIDSAFARVIGHCASSPRKGSSEGGTWILPQMQQAYLALHDAGHVHSVETWVDGELLGGLYCVAIGQAVYGESMFALARDASKIALAALVALCRAHGIVLIDCQQNTAHLASLGAGEIARSRFVRHCAQAITQPAPRWIFEPLYWQQLLAERDANQ
ncbi:MAG: leucyl/phenylalanyl-tRNA--protein transferase [Burkholderiaceae bacterium]